MEIDIYTKGTIDAVIQVFPSIISDKIWEMTKDSFRAQWKEFFGCIQTQMDVAQKQTVNASNHFQAIKENTASYVACVNNLDDKRNAKSSGKYKNSILIMIASYPEHTMPSGEVWGALNFTSSTLFKKGVITSNPKKCCFHYGQISMLLSRM